MVRRQPVAVILLVTFVMLNASLVFGQSSQLQIAMIGQGAGPYVVPAGQVSELQLEILNVAPEDVYLIHGDAYLEPNQNGTWVIIVSQSLGSFHINFLQSAIWTFNIEMPSMIQASNATNGVPQVVLLIQITYLTGGGLQETQQKQFLLSVPGATVGQPYALTWIAAIAIVIVLVACIVAYRAYRKTQPKPVKS